MRSYYANIIQVGNDYAYLNERDAVCGLLKCLDDKISIRESKTHHKPTSTARVAYLREKHVIQGQKHTEKRRERRREGMR